DNLFSKVNINIKNTFIPDGMADDVEKTCQRYEHGIKGAGGIDIQVLGVGASGHIGFNEQTSSLASRTRIKTLTLETRTKNASEFKGIVGDVPKHAITMGIGTIMESRKVIMLAFGERKAAAVGKLAEGPITAMVPASILQMHPEAKIIVDQAAGSKLTL